MSISNADRDTSGIERVAPMDPETQRAARLAVCKAALNQPDPRADAEQLLDMLGIGRKAAAAEKRDGGCLVCGRALSLHALSGKNGLKGTCSKQCKAVLYPGQGAK